MNDYLAIFTTMERFNRKLRLATIVLFCAQFGSSLVALDLALEPTNYRHVSVVFHDLLSDNEVSVVYGYCVKPESQRIEYVTDRRIIAYTLLAPAEAIKLHGMVRKILTNYSLEESTDLESIMDKSQSNNFTVEIGTVETSIVLRYNAADDARLKEARACFDWLQSKRPSKIESKAIDLPK
jgi:hypothetical protein